VIVTLIKYVILFFLLIIKRHLDAKKLISKMENLIIRLARKKKNVSTIKILIIKIFEIRKRSKWFVIFCMSIKSFICGSSNDFELVRSSNLFWKRFLPYQNICDPIKNLIFLVI
jgi:hypothetical protein